MRVDYCLAQPELGMGVRGLDILPLCMFLNDHESTPTSCQIGLGITNNCYPVGKFINNED